MFFSFSSHKNGVLMLGRCRSGSLRGPEMTLFVVHMTDSCLI